MMSTETGDLMQRGIALLNINTNASLTESLSYFDQAIGIRRQLLAPGDPQAAYLLAASWMNRGDASTRLGGAFRLAEALRSYDEALTVLREVPPAASPLYRRRHAVAWINRGLTLHEQGTEQAMVEAIRSFERGMDEIRDDPEHHFLLAYAWVNHGKALLRLRPVRATEARGSAAAALELVKSIEAQEPLAAETSFKAQIVLCQAAAELLADVADPEEVLTLVCAATDAVEAGLRLARLWKAGGKGHFGSLTTDLFRFGVAIYRRHQPQFLAEFVLDSLDISLGPEAYRLAAAALQSVANQLPADGFASLHTARGARLLETLRALRLVEGRL